MIKGTQKNGENALALAKPNSELTADGSTLRPQTAEDEQEAVLTEVENSDYDIDTCWPD